jgi:formylglycine-generating enzyme
VWPFEERWRAPLGDFPPSWASAWGDDPYGLWADLIVNRVIQRMRWIEPSGPEGFWMGEKQIYLGHEIVDTGLWLADTPCTQAFWTAVVGNNPSHFHYQSDAAERPVECVNWDNVMNQFIARFAAMPAWGTEGRLCLPTEVEWEYAARCGTSTAYWWGDVWDTIRGNSNVTGKRTWDDTGGTTPVQCYRPNPWGLYDMHGNVWEWCADVWQPRRDASEARLDKYARVVRGGSWVDHSGNARAAYRLRAHRKSAHRSLGFRFALRSIQASVP